ncbi:TFB4 [Candida oxycetoniae]|uniref:General transcription and DNA repair factor IIH subunit TFB4 n=1 Tax=Candida oxycetoniae TaxID=497107 RepID=A0AAI9WWN6_9ASCO|nr:TFB4 [Candida oxycetoniae]KAI3402919.1 TFB4 [Candida oxycetoniae]
MGRMHSSGKGISSSAIPYSRNSPSWFKLSSNDVVEQIIKYARKGLTPSSIGVVLRDAHGVSQTKVVTGNKILRILKSNGLAPEIPEDLYFLIKKAVSVRKHLGRNRKDKDSKFRLILIESRIHRLARYYRSVSTSLESSTNDDPSLLTIILDVSSQGWFNIRNSITLEDIAKSLLVFLNGHLSLNNSNQVAFIASSSTDSKFLYPHPSVKSTCESRMSPGMYRQFKKIDEVVLQELTKFIEETSKVTKGKGPTITGAISMALTYTNRMLTLDQSITTTTASAITTASMNSSAKAASGVSLSTSSSAISMKSRILIVSANDSDDSLNYIPLMNCIFTAQKLKVSIDIAKLGHKNSSYLQQASDATNGVYLHIEDPRGMIQLLSTAFFIEPNLRPYIILPTNSQVNYKASCFITKKPVDLGYVCSICLCIMSKIPENAKCPACSSDFDKKLIQSLNRNPQVTSKKKRKLEKQPLENGD